MSTRALLLAVMCLTPPIGLFSIGEGHAQSVQSGEAVGNHGGAIRAMGATGYNKRRGNKEPGIDIPPINEGEASPRGLPRGTTGRD